MSTAFDLAGVLMYCAGPFSAAEEHIEASQSVVWVARNVAALPKVVSAPFSPPSAVPVVDFERQASLEEVEREGIEEPMGWDDA